MTGLVERIQNLQRIVHNYKQYFDYLIELGIVESDKFYIEGEKSIGYMISPDYMSEVVANGINNYFLEKKLSQIRQSNIISKTNYPYIKWYDDQLSIDYKQALDQLNKEKEINIINDENPIKKYNNTYITIDRFNDGDYNVSVDDTVGRLHSRLTGMKKEYLKFIKYGNDELVSVDISNSQPYFSTILFNPEFYSKNSLINIYQFLSSIEHLAPSFVSNPTNFYSSSLFLTLVKIAERPMNSDLRLYIDLVKKGQIYDYMLDNYRLQTGDTTKSRDDIKEDVLIAINANSVIYGRYAKQKQLFREIFPTVWELISAFKTEDSKFLSNLLLRIESHLILKVIMGRLNIDYPDIPIFSKHDCIVTTMGNEHIVKSIIIEELTNYIGITPTLKTEYGLYQTEVIKIPEIIEEDLKEVA